MHDVRVLKLEQTGSGIVPSKVAKNYLSKRRNRLEQQERRGVGPTQYLSILSLLLEVRVNIAKVSVK